MTLMIYGATGYTGQLIAQRTKHLKPILAGRNKPKIKALAQQHFTPYRQIDHQSITEQDLQGVTVIINAVGKQAQRPLIEAALKARVHYLDLSGEYPEFQTALQYHQDAQNAGIMLMPGVGFGVVPTDTLALHLKKRLPDATHLSLAFETSGGVSEGTLDTVLSDLSKVGARMRNGHLIPTPAAWQGRTVNFGAGNVQVLTNPWRADVLTAQRTTGIENIDTFALVPAALKPLFMVSRYARGILKIPAVTRAIRQQASKDANPDQHTRQQGFTRLWGEALNPQGKRVVSTMDGPEAYDYTAMTAALIAEKVLKGEHKAGFQTPAGVYGADLLLGLPGVTRHDH